MNKADYEKTMGRIVKSVANGRREHVKAALKTQAMVNNPVYYSSAKGDWGTPRWLFESLNREFQFTIDAAADQGNALCRQWYGSGGVRTCSLESRWEKTGQIYWLNPPYGRGIGRFMERAAEAGDSGNIVVCLVPARVDTKWWNDYVLQADEIRFIRGRLKFVGAENGAPFPSAIVIWDKRLRKPTVKWVDV